METEQRISYIYTYDVSFPSKNDIKWRWLAYFPEIDLNRKLKIYIFSYNLLVHWVLRNSRYFYSSLFFILLIKKIEKRERKHYIV